jgi:hypothetical protein
MGLIPIKRLYVVAMDETDGGNLDREVYTLSFDPNELGWENDCNCPGYGLAKDVAEAIAEQWNKQLNPGGK